MKKLKTIIYWCSLVAPIVDIIRGAWNAIVNIAVQDEMKRQEIQFMMDSTVIGDPVRAEIKFEKGVKNDG